MKKLAAYEFTLVLDDVDDQTEGLEDQLSEGGCDDALINYRNGMVYLDFNREAFSVEDAVISAIKDIEKSTICAKVISILLNDQDSATDILELLNKNCQDKMKRLAILEELANEAQKYNMGY